MTPLPGRTSVDRCLIRHGLVTPQARKRQAVGLQAVGTRPGDGVVADGHRRRVRLADGSEAKIVSGIDDHSPVRGVGAGSWRGRRPGRCAMRLSCAMTAHGVPEEILTDNGKVFTARFGPGPGPVLFDRICAENGIRHILTAPRSPTTTGKVERWHKTLRREFLDGKVFASIADAQAQLDGWVRHYNHERPHQSIGRVPPDRTVPARRAAARPGQAARPRSTDDSGSR